MTDKDKSTSRRGFSRIAGGVAGAATIGGLSGCLGNGDSDGTPTEEQPEETSTESDPDSTTTSSIEDPHNLEVADTLNYWAGGPLNPGTFEDLEDEYGISANHTVAPLAPGTILNRFLNGSASTDFDLFGLTTPFYSSLAEEGVIFPSDVESLPNWEHTYPILKEGKWSEMFKQDGEFHTIPTIANGDSVAFLPEKVGDPGSVSSYGVLYDDEFQGRTSMAANSFENFYKTAHYLDYNDMADLPSITQMNPDPSVEDIDKVIQFIEKEKNEGQFRTFWTGWTNAVNLLQQEEVWAMDTWEPVVMALRAEDEDVAYLNPDEGWALFAQGQWRTEAGDASEEKRNAVKAFNNWVLDGWWGAKVTSQQGYLTPTDRAVEYANESDEFDADYISERHEIVKEKFDDPEGFQFAYYPSEYRYLQEQWSELTS